ncbi:MAG: hypothetical protein DHS80DRAFT_26692 [Piptocephalis tieghemiana]|nr:MAG: hypothetical protein DHS80DRAFT_26692 [Piptocephalis tieghemiana]
MPMIDSDRKGTNPQGSPPYPEAPLPPPPPPSLALTPPAPLLIQAPPLPFPSLAPLNRERLPHFFIRIFRQDTTFATVSCPLSTSAAEVCQILGRKLFLPNVDNYVLYLARPGKERVLAANERPLALQKRWLEQAGYTAEDRLVELGGEDHGYFFKFIFGTIRPLPAIKLPKEVRTPQGGWTHQHFDLQSRNLPIIPRALYRFAPGMSALDLSRNQGLELPLDFIVEASQLKALRLSENEYKQVPPAVRHAVSLETLDLSGNRFREVELGQLHCLTRLRSLRLQGNRLTSLPPSWGQGHFESLTTLYLGNNRFDAFPEVITSLPSLTDLDLSFNHIGRIPESIGDLRNLERLLLLGNHLTGALPKAFEQLKALQELDLRENALQELGVLARLPKLTLLFVDGNAVTTLALEFPSLQDLTLRRNHLTYFKPSPMPTTSLHYLNLSKSKLAQLKDDFFEATPNLRRLVLDGNSLVTLPKSICRLQALSSLSCTDNLLTTLPVDIWRLRSLTSLDMHTNNLGGIPAEIWWCPSLITLNASSNLISGFPGPREPPRALLEQEGLSPYSSSSSSSGLGSSTSPASSPTRKKAMAAGTLHPQQAPLASTLKHLFLGDNHLSDDIFPPLMYFSELRILNLSHNNIYEIPRNGFYNMSSLEQLHLGGNHLTSIPAEEVGRLRGLRELFLNGNKLQTLPAELGKIIRLKVLDVGSNSLKYNISNFPYDWNWNWNLELKHLNLSGNKKLEIKMARNDQLHLQLMMAEAMGGDGAGTVDGIPSGPGGPGGMGAAGGGGGGGGLLAGLNGGAVAAAAKGRNYADFSTLQDLRILGLMDVTLMVTVPDESHDRRIRLTSSDAHTVRYGMADTLGRSDALCTWDLVSPRFRGREEECLFALFDGRMGSTFGGGSGSGSKVTKFLNDWVSFQLTAELKKLETRKTSIKSTGPGSTSDATQSPIRKEDVCGALRRTFLSLEKELGLALSGVARTGASALMIYLAGTTLYSANVGDALAVVSRNGGNAQLLSTKHTPWDVTETARIQSAGGWVSHQGHLNGELEVSRAFGHLHLLPVVNANPHVEALELGDGDEFVIMASRGLWEKVSYQTAVDVARTEAGDEPMLAAQKLRDFAIAYGADESILVMIIGVEDLFDKRRRAKLGPRLVGLHDDSGMMGDEGIGPAYTHRMTSTSVSGISEEMWNDLKRNRRGKGTDPQQRLGDSSLARLPQELDAPTGQVALVFTDIKNSTFLWETLPKAMQTGIKLHNRIMRRHLRIIGGYEVKTEGDAFMVSFPQVSSALLWCLTVQLKLLQADWPKEILASENGREKKKEILLYRGLWVRMGIHWGEPHCEEDPVTRRMDYFGPMVNRSARISGVADGGQICVSQDVIAEMDALSSLINVPEEELDPATLKLKKEVVAVTKLGYTFVSIGERRLKGLETPEVLSLVYPRDLEQAKQGWAEEEEARKRAASRDVSQTSPSASPFPKSPGEEGSHGLDRTGRMGGMLLGGVTSPSSPSSGLLNPASIRYLGYVCLRLERLTSGEVAAAGTADAMKRRTKYDHLHGLLTLSVKDGAGDEELMRILENLVARIEVSEMDTVGIKGEG